MELTQARGKLMAIGGAEDRKGDCRILKEFIRLSGGAKANIVVMTAATNQPESEGKERRTLFTKLGAKTVKVVDVSTRADALNEKNIETVSQATGIFFTGGNQFHITTLIGGTELQRLINRMYEKGTIVAGTSAGAAMMSNSMILNGEGEDSPRLNSIELGPGMDFIVGSIIDTHFSQRGRYGRLLTAVAHHPQELGIGLDEDTAIITSGDKEFEVLGSGAVTVMDGSSLTYTNAPYTKPGEILAMADVKLHVLPEGMKYNFESRSVIAPKSKNGNGHKEA